MHRLMCVHILDTLVDFALDAGSHKLKKLFQELLLVTSTRYIRSEIKSARATIIFDLRSLVMYTGFKHCSSWNSCFYIPVFFQHGSCLCRIL
jgi:hypothetical protein